MTFTGIEAVIGGIIALIAAAGTAFTIWKKLLTVNPPPAHSPKKNDHEECLTLARDAREQVGLLEQKVNGEIHVRMNRVEDDVQKLFTKMEKTLDLIIAQLEKN